MPIQTFFVMLVAGQSTLHVRSTRVSAVNTVRSQPVAFVAPAPSSQFKTTDAVVYQRSQWSRPEAVSQFAARLWACAEVASPQPQILTTASTTAKRRVTATAPS